ncbi:MAG: hypothetical protein ACYCW6_16130 [Candidatus Xenobia bacterium]
MEREARVTAGIDDLERWLRDLLLHGLAEAQRQSYSFWERPAARLVDAQAPGLARVVRSMGSLAHSGEGWADRLLEAAGRLQLLIAAWRRIDSLEPEMQAEVRGRIGFTVHQETVRESPGVHDQWFVLGQRIEEGERLRTRYTWLVGTESRRPALLLAFAPAGGFLPAALPPGMLLEAELAFYPGVAPQRALLKTVFGEHPAQAVRSHPDFLAASGQYAERLAANPWTDSVPLCVRGVVPLPSGWMRDAQGRGVRMHRRFEDPWPLLAVSGGRPVTVCGEWDGSSWWPLSVWTEGNLQCL